MKNFAYSFWDRYCFILISYHKCNIFGGYRILEINILMNILVIVIQLTFISNFKKIDIHHKIIRDHNVWEIGFQLAVDKCDQYHSHSDTT